MSLADRLAGTITSHSKAALAVMLVLTLVVGAGAPMVDDDSSLGQFESESPEVKASEYIAENFTVEGAENMTTVQVIVRGNGENVLSQESLVDSLRFQQSLRENESINATLADENAITGVENIAAITHIRGQEAADLQERGAELENRTERLNETTAELEQRSQQLNETVEGLNESLVTVVGLEREYAALNASYEAGEIDESTYQEESAALESRLEETVATTTADLDAEQTATFEATVSDLRKVVNEETQLERQYEAGNVSDDEYETQSAELAEQRVELFEQGTAGVLADEFEQLEEDSEALEEDWAQLEEDSEALQADQEALRTADQPSLEDQIEALEGLDDEEYEELIADVLSDDGEDTAALSFMPADYEPGETSAEARMLFVTQNSEGGGMAEMGGGGGPALDAQLDMQTLASEDDGGDEYLIFGAGVITDEIDRSMGDSLAIVGPLALLFVVAALAIAYRDLIDITLGVLGILLVLVWTFGFMGWADIAFNQMFVAVPVLLIGLSIDYAIHVFMRHREQREEAGTTDDVRGSMRVALAGVGVALVWVTATTVIGFLSNLISPIAPIRDFGIVSSFGIVAALAIFGVLIPAAKVELDGLLESRGFDRRKRAFGTGNGRFSDALTLGSTAARKAPLVILVVALLFTAGGVYGASQVDTSFSEEDFLAESPPAWTENLGPLSPGEYTAKSNLDYVNDHFQRQDVRAQVLVEGDVTDPETLERLDAAESAAAANEDVVYVLPNGEADVSGPLSTMRDVAAENESFNETFTAAGGGPDSVPTENLEGVYDHLLEVEPSASQYVYRTDDGEYEAVQLSIAVQGNADLADVTAEMRAIADDIDDGGTDSRWEATATGDPVVNHVVENDLMQTVLESLLITLVAVVVFLSVAYWLTGKGATLGVVTLLPVALAVSWILGSMYLLGMSFNVLTGMITSLTIGLGIAYSIHVSSRYMLELERHGNVWTAMETTVTGTGGALLGSAATTVGGFGVLAFAILPVLRQFGIITGLTIIYAFLASVIVLPTLLVLWTRYLGPDLSSADWSTDRPTPASDGGREASDAITGGDDE
ncbi:MMPL family transporter [Natronosalvus rutilus]|uniref:MMPL family transporter n=1 Tax=Natronosalvus rutilus TaxID=2953753 RepID=A0A9E7SW87_9EURY|nr:MMPL family transporter [Natronosalvus rutilus]UTF55255.1 MMPL family transporter [Natronosalvus rutilus]